jgi:hypothetical protein
MVSIFFPVSPLAPTDRHTRGILTTHACLPITATAEHIRSLTNHLIHQYSRAVLLPKTNIGTLTGMHPTTGMHSSTQTPRA